MSSNASELGKTIAELNRCGRLEKIDSARLQMVRSMARALDADPANAALWRQYREALKELTTDDSNSSVDEALANLFPAVRDTPST